jgi:hypothetical protein
MSKTYNLFLSHSWAYGDAYDKLEKMITNRPYFSWKDFSVPKNDPIHSRNDRELREAIDNKIRLCHAIIVLAGVYSTYSKWINIEIQIAQSYGKPIIAIQPWGAEKTSKTVKDAATRVVGWNTESIINAIKELA